MNALNITTKASYLKFCQEWKAEYKKQSLEIRTLKHEFKEAQRNMKKDSSGIWFDPIQLRLKLKAAKSKATSLLELRKASKIQAQQAYEAEHEQVAA